MTGDFATDLVALLPNVRRFALSLTRSADMADELVQVACEKAIANKSGFEPGTRLDAWLFRIVRNSWIDLARRRKTQGTQVEIDDVPTAAVTDGRQTTESRLMLDSVWKAIDTLPEEQREVLVLVCVEDLSYKEASAVLDIPIGTVMSRLARARLAIAKITGGRE